jgi:hypothetical protein
MLTFVKEALSLKISRERIGEELDKMMKGGYPAVALHKQISLQELARKRPSSIDTANPRAFSVSLHILDP